MSKTTDAALPLPVNLLTTTGELGGTDDANDAAPTNGFFHLYDVSSTKQKNNSKTYTNSTTVSW
jgi:hypothetical protein